nr:M23 family metallopeptidase [Bacteriovoracaceae bacterium]
KSKEMEYELVQVQEQIKKQEEHLSTLTRKISKTWQDYLATQMGTQKTVIRMQQKKVYAKAIDTMVQNFSKLLAQKDQTQADFFKMKEKFKIHQKKEEILLSLVADMEGRREQVESSLNKEKMTLDEIEAKKELLPRGQKTALKASHETWEDFELPFKSGLQSKKKLKGLALEYVRQESLRTPAEGIVEYVGPLAVYGQVIMVDHGAKIRSIMLGEIESFVVAGNKVHKGQTIGTTKGQKGELYFEIRRENMAQNIMAWAHKKQKS